MLNSQKGFLKFIHGYFLQRDLAYLFQELLRVFFMVKLKVINNDS